MSDPHLGTVIIGVGIDVVPVARFAESLARTPALADRLFTQAERRTASGGMLRHKVQAVVIVAVLFIATASATLGLALLNANNSPFAKAFATQHGADLTVTANPGRADAGQLAATARVAGVTAQAGPFGATTIPLQFEGQPWGQNTLVGRPVPGSPVDDLVLNAGHWADGPGQVVVAGNPAPDGGGVVLGSVLTAPGLPGTPSLTVVGFANSVTGTADAWVTPGELSSLVASGGRPTAQRSALRMRAYRPGQRR